MLKIEDVDNNLMNQEIRFVTLTQEEQEVITGGLEVSSLPQEQAEQIQERLGKIYQNTGAVSR
jgi:hypothetical protein